MTERRGCDLDHLVVTTPVLAVGVAWVESNLGVTLQVGGEHQRMATHNALLRLGDSTYLEVIAPNPESVRPNRPRWFEIDRFKDDEPPRLATWVARSADITGTAAQCSAEFGQIEPMSRGSLNWLITIPSEGALIAGGVIPMLIEWAAGSHPAARLEDKGCALKQLDLFHPDMAMVVDTLGCLGLRDDARIRPMPTRGRPYLVAVIDTPRGRRSIGAPSDLLSAT
jgi:glyoxalase-like protein